jgi:ubiquinone/menaquinone biosynthesis C-methylase UbiE
MGNPIEAPKAWYDPASYEDFYRTPPSKIILGIWQDVFGEDYASEVETAGFVTRSDLIRIVDYLRIGPGSMLADLGCGRGGAGLWLARETGADLIGIDLSVNGVAQASGRIGDFGLAGRARFLSGDICATGLPDAVCNAAVSIDVLWFVPDKVSAMREAARILKPGAPFAFTAFELRDSDSYRAALQESEFEVEVYEDKPEWRSKQLAVYGKVLAAQAAIIEEMGDGGRTLVAEARDCVANGLADIQHMFVIARRPRH